jgi:hypothetical protein
MTTTPRKSIWSFSEVQRQAIAAEMASRPAMLQQLYRRCPHRRCRRMESCIAADRPCLKAPLPPLSERAKQRLVRDVKRSPPRL